MYSEKEFIRKSAEILFAAEKEISALPPLILRDFDTKKTAVILVDIINGFVKEGTLSDSCISRIIPPSAELLRYAVSVGMKAIAFADCHTAYSSEFSTFPAHCIKGSCECEIADELKKIGGYTLIEKNSVNGFHTAEFQKFLSENSGIENFIVCGCCTDICVMTFCLTLKSWFDEKNRKCRIAVPVNMTETYDGDGHIRDFVNVASFLLMRSTGIELWGGAEFE